MRNLVYLFVIMFFAQVAMAQAPSPMKPYATLKSAVEKLESELKEPQQADFPDEKKYQKAKAKYDKKVANPSTWFTLGETYKEIYMYAGANIGYGAPAQTTMFLKGTPKEKATLENKETWIYEDFKVHFEDGVVKKWEMNEEYPDAMKKAVAAYKKVFETDVKAAFQKKVIASLVELRNYTRVEGIMYYFDKQLDRAVKAYTCSSNLYSMEEMKAADTVGYNISEVYYYGAAFADANNDYENAVSFYSKNIEYCKVAPEKCTDFVKSYRYLANDYKQMGNAEMQEKTMMEAYASFPEDKDILVDLTQLYLDGGNSAKALEFLDKALEKDPNNHLYVFVKGTLFDGFKTKVYEQMDLLRKEVYIADTARQEGKLAKKDFTTLKETKMAEIEALWPNADLEMTKAKDMYKQALVIEPEYFNAKFNLGAILYNKGAQIIKMADLIPTSDMKSYDREMEEAKVIFEEALPFLEEAVVIEPENLAVLQTLSTVYAKLGKYDKVKELKTRVEEIEAKESSKIK